MQGQVGGNNLSASRAAIPMARQSEYSSGNQLSSENKILNSWKEIAQYLSRGVRTVQRWERDLRLPVRRPYNKQRSAVIAFSADIDAWLQRIPARALSGPHCRSSVCVNNLQRIAENRERMRSRMERLYQQTDRLVTMLKKMQERQRDIDSTAAAA